MNVRNLLHRINVDILICSERWTWKFFLLFDFYHSKDCASPGLMQAFYVYRFLLHLRTITPLYYTNKFYASSKFRYHMDTKSPSFSLLSALCFYGEILWMYKGRIGENAMFIC